MTPDQSRPPAPGEVKDLWIDRFNASWDSEAGVVWLGTFTISPNEIRALAAWAERNNLQ